jgi:protein ImuA
MMGRQKEVLLADLQSQIARVEAGGGLAHEQNPSFNQSFSLGEAAVDAVFPTGGLTRAALHEVMAAEHRDRPAALGFTLALLGRMWRQLGGHDRRPVLWCQQADSAFDFGSLYGPGLAAFGCDPTRLITVTARSMADVLWAMEEGLKCTALSGVVGAFGRGSPELGLTATRRLQLAAEASGVTALLLRLPNDDPAGVARTRWRIAARPSQRPMWLGSRPDVARNYGIGRPSWQVRLEKCRGGQPAVWEMEWEYAAHRFCLAAPMADGSAVPGVGAEEPQGEVVAFQAA